MLQGFYVNMVYHSYAMTYGGDNSVLNEPGWVQSWVALLKQVLESDVCQVCSCSAYYCVVLAAASQCGLPPHQC